MSALFLEWYMRNMGRALETDTCTEAALAALHAQAPWRSRPGMARTADFACVEAKLRMVAATGKLTPATLLAGR